MNIGTCDYKNCKNEATTKGFVVLKGVDENGKLKTADMYSCDKHKNKDGFFEYVDENETEDVNVHTNNLVAEVTEIISKEVPVDAGQLVQSFPESKVVTFRSRKPLLDKELQEQLNDEWYVKNRGINYNFGVAGINVIGEEE